MSTLSEMQLLNLLFGSWSVFRSKLPNFQRRNTEDIKVGELRPHITGPIESDLFRALLL
jgi:hypothetical protein